MTKLCSCVLRVLAVTVVCTLSQTRSWADWTTWRGPRGDGVSTETGLLDAWPEDGPRLLWKASGLGDGYATVSVYDGHVFTTGVIDGKGTVFCLTPAGQLRWSTPYGEDVSQGSYKGTRTTPTIARGRVLTMSGFGLVTCMDAPTGRILWQVDTVQVFGAENTTWNISESLLVVDGWVICTPGGSTALLAALDLETGETVWATPGTGAKSAYCSPLLVETGGNRVIVTMVETGLVGVDLRNGDLLWHVPHKNRHAVHAPTPVYADGLIAFSSGYGEGTVALRLSDDGRQVRPLWQSKDLDNHHGGIILHQGALYGTNNRELVCMDLRTGKVNWTERRVGKGALSMADGMLYAYNEKGVVSLARVSPQAGEVVSSFRVTEGSGQHWAHPVIDNGRLYIRHGDTLLVFDVAGGA